MINDFLNKKLLILGATTETVPMVKKAEELGCKTFVVDPFKDAAAKKYSSNPIELDCFDIKKLKELVIKNNIDGILPGCADILVPVYEQLCRELNKYCYVNEELINVFNNKKGLKEVLKKYNLPTIEEYKYEDVMKGDFDKFPVFVKPVDNNSSKGMSIANDIESFKEAYQKALENSKSKTVLIEKKEDCDDFFVGFFLQNGNIENTFSADRYVIKQGNHGTITAGMTYPSKYNDLYLKEVHPIMKKIFDELNFKNGIIAIQGFVENNKIIFYDPALRITGGQEYILSKYFYDLDVTECLIRFALTGNISNNENEYLKCDSNFGGRCASNLAFSVKGGKIGKIVGAEYAKKHSNVLNVTQEHKEGDLIDKIGTAQQNVFRMHVVANTFEELRDVIANLQDNVIVYDENNESMMLEGINPINWYNERKTI